MGVLLTITSILAVIKIVESAFGEPDVVSYTNEDYCQITRISDEKQHVSRSSLIYCDKGLKNNVPISGTNNINIVTVAPRISSNFYTVQGQIPRRINYSPSNVLNNRTTKSSDVLRKAVILERAGRHLPNPAQKTRFNQFIRTVKQESLAD